MSCGDRLNVLPRRSTRCSRDSGRPGWRWSASGIYTACGGRSAALYCGRGSVATRRPAVTSSTQPNQRVRTRAPQIANGDRVLAPPVDTALLQEVVRRVVAAAEPERIILFGSFAWGTPRADSDLDLLVVTTSQRPPAEQGITIRRALCPHLVPIDVIVRSPREIAARLQLGDPFMREVCERGRVLYERNRSRQRR